MKYRSIIPAAVLAVTITQSNAGDGGMVPIPTRLSPLGLSHDAFSSARANTTDVGGRLFRNRSGLGRDAQQLPAPVVDGGGAKGGMVAAPAVGVPYAWEVYGGVFYSNWDVDLQSPAARFVNLGNDVESVGGFVGVKRRLSETLAVGLAVAGSSTDSDLGLFGSTDVDAYSLTPYVGTYYEDILGGADLWTDLMYAYTDQSYSTVQLPGIFGNTDGTSHTIDLNLGLNFGGARLVHGPYAGVRWTESSIDSYVNSVAVPVAGVDEESLLSTLGYQVSSQLPVSGGTVLLQFRAAWEHEFGDGTSTQFGIPLLSPDEDFAVLGAGVGFYGDSGWSALLDYEATLASDTEGHHVGLKIGKKF